MFDISKAADNLNHSSSSINLSIDASTNIFPIISIEESDSQILELRNKIQKLKLELTLTHDEINKLSLENMDLKQKQLPK